ncbi:hypothetical protein KJ567_00255 [Candidatus Bipolaricaulota bacterium]|nr:hypothetical protein [Candidatus Bipolaricaulota bacterium]
MIWIIGIAAALGVVLLLLGSAPEVPETADVTPSTYIASDVASRASTTAPAYTRAVPFVDAGSDQSVYERSDVVLDGQGYDPNGGSVIYRWTDSSNLGYFEDPHSPTTIYTAPSACDCDDTICLTLTVTNTAGISISDDLVLTVLDPLSCTLPAPTCETSGTFVIVTNPERCEVAKPTCPISPDEPCSSPCITDVAPDSCSEIPVACGCIESTCGTREGGWPFDPDPVDLHPRDQAKARMSRQLPSRIAEGTAVAIRGYVENPACLSTCFTWSVSKGRLDGEDTLQPIYHAPESHRVGGETVTITFSVFDSAGAQSYDQIRIHIDNVSGPGSS